MTTPDLLVSVVMQRKRIGQDRWSVDSWEAIGVLPHEQGQPGERRTLRDDPDVSQYLWPALSVSLYPDRARSYGYNLAGNTPSVYVLCHEEADGAIRPATVTVDPDEASAAIEGDYRVYALPMTGRIYTAVESFLSRYPVSEYRPPRKQRNGNGRTKP